MTMKHKAAIGSGFALVAALAAVGVLAFSAEASKNPGLVPENLRALGLDATALPDVPSIARAIGDPSAGDVHRLGFGALAWQSGGEICYVARGGGGCVTRLQKPISVAIGDPDMLRSGLPAYVSGIATDDVVSVTAALKDGRTIGGRVIDNFYYLPLPADASVYDVSTIRASLADGSEHSEDVSGGEAPANP